MGSDLKELISQISLIIDDITRDNNVISFSEHNTITPKVCAEVNNISIEKYFGKNKSGFSLKDLGTNNQIIVFKNGGIILVDSNNAMTSYNIREITDANCKILIDILQDMLNHINTKVNKH